MISREIESYEYNSIDEVAKNEHIEIETLKSIH